MKRGVLILMLVFASVLSFAQPPGGPGGGNRREQIKAIKVAFITSEINLTAKQAEKFWPIYNEYEKKRHEIRHQLKELRRLRKDTTVAKSEEDIKKNLDKYFELKDKEIKLDKTYKDKFLTVISANQLLDLYLAEEKFKHYVHQAIREKRQQGNGRHGPRHRPE